MEKIIEVDIFEEKDLVDNYNRKQVSDKLINYIVNQTPTFRIKDNLKIVINNNIKNTIDIEKSIIDGFSREYKKSYQIHFQNTMIQLIYLVVGVLIIFLSTLINGEVFREVTLICGWVLIWATVELEIFSDIEGRKRRKKLKKLLNSEIIIKN